MSGNYRLGPKAPATPDNMWDIIRGMVAADPGLSHSRLLGRMTARDPSSWPEKVRRKPSKLGVGSDEWCHGYINGAVREGYLVRSA